MSSVEEETPTVSPEHCATGETATLVQLAEADGTTKNSKATDRGETEEVYPKRTLIFCWP